MSTLSRAAALPIAGGALLGLILLGIFVPQAVTAGWLIAFVSIGTIVFGSVAWMLIHALTGGGWGRLVQPAFRRAARATPLLLATFIVLLINAGALYPWRHAPTAAGPGVAGLYLNIGFFAARGLIVIAGLAVASLFVQRDPSPLTAGLGLVWYGVGMDLVAVDWLLSLSPRYTSSAFGAQIIVQQLIAALAWAILTTHASRDKDWRDLASLLFATILGETYLILMTFIIHWYGDQPQQAAWYLQRSTGGWIVLELVGLLVGAIGPLVALLFAKVRNTPRLLKRVAAAALLGTFIETIWLVAPATNGWSILTGLVAVVALASLAIGLSDRPWYSKWSASHGI